MAINVITIWQSPFSMAHFSMLPWFTSPTSSRRAPLQICAAYCHARFLDSRHVSELVAVARISLQEVLGISVGKWLICKVVPPKRYPLVF